MKRAALASIIGLALIGMTVAGCQATRAGYESAPYTVVRKDGRFEVRDYPTLQVVGTSTTPGSNGSDGSFMKLFRYITGGNERREKIAMTTPVLMQETGGDYQMSFVLPQKVRTSGPPAPTDASLKVRELPPARYAVLRFRGGRNRPNETRSLEALRSWLQKESMTPEAGPVYAYFDPPWIPAFLCRNEVMLRIPASAR